MTQQQQQQQRQPDDQFHGAAATIASAAHLHSQQSFITCLTPGSALLLSSFPLGLGAYIGYRRTLHESPSLPSSSTSPSSNGGLCGGRGNSILGQIIHLESSKSSSRQHANQFASPPNTRVVGTTPPPIVAARALVIGSLISISATSLLVSGVFLASGCRSLDELMSTWKSWAPRRLHAFENSLENYLGIQVGEGRRSAKFEYEQAIKGMTEEEELEYARDKYGGRGMPWEADGDE
ncbi:hypothetical protein ACHAXA_000255 [Cyclostephanos tholiformis]|uniref:Uncharacterized protein n=1 Tax=Cyclostephanos tholiformis TaxID=382380 RepID=A0ABD3SBF6_9STRA